MTSNQFITVPVQVDNVTTRVIIDTGSAVNVISSSFVGRLRKLEELRPSPITVRAVSGELATPKGEMRLRLGLAGQEFDVQFFMLDGFHHDLLCGLPFCRDTRLVLDFEHRKLRILVSELDMESSDHPLAKKITNVYVAENCTIPPKSEIMFTAKSESRGLRIVEASPRQSRRKEIVVASSLVNMVEGKERSA